MKEIKHSNRRSRKFDDSEIAKIKRRKSRFVIVIILGMIVGSFFIYPKIIESNALLAHFTKHEVEQALVDASSDASDSFAGETQTKRIAKEDSSSQAESSISESDNAESSRSLESSTSETSSANADRETEASAAESSVAQTEESKTNESVSPHRVEYMTVDDSYFSDALFIGDSRTVGIKEYGKLTTPDYFCSNGLSSYTIFKESLKVPKFGNTTLKNLLAKKDYKKIYIMIGINEMGNDFKEVMSKINQLIITVQESEPGALIYLQGNLHVTAQRSNKDKYFNNRRINELNSYIAANADNITVFYLEPNVLFDDANGDLRQDYSSDNTHIYAKHYIQWTDWIKTKAIKR